MADRPRDLAERMARRRKMAGKPGQTVGDGYLRETFAQRRAKRRRPSSPAIPRPAI